MRLRESVRALILDPDDCVLLVRFDWDGLDVEGGFWANPGGGVEPGESRLAAMQRELREETGLDVRPEWIEAPRWLRQIEYVYRGVCRHRRAGGRSSRS